jgi:hypothetical protein
MQLLYNHYCYIATVTETVGDSDEDELQAEAERLREEAFQLKLQHQLQQKHLQHQAQLQILQLSTKAGIGRHANDPLTEVQPVAVDGLNSRSMVATLGVFKARKVSVTSNWRTKLLAMNGVHVIACTVTLHDYTAVCIALLCVLAWTCPQA